MFDGLDASGFKGAVPFYEKEFEEVLSKVVKCYQLMLDSQAALINDENKIRDVLLLNYLKSNEVRTKIG